MKGLTPPALHEVSGVIHCHSTYSDGAESVPVIADAANRAGLDYLIMTDHDTLAPLYEIGEQWHQNTLLLMGCEITPRNNHYLALGITQAISPHLPPAEYVAAVAAQGGIGFMAHPFEHGSPVLGQNSYSWEDWSVVHDPSITGMEVWNYFSEWIGHCQTVPATVRAIADWKRATHAPDPRTLDRWDELGRTRRVAGIGGVDAHGVKRRVMGREFVIHPYLKSFRTIRTHLLLAEPFSHRMSEDRRLVMDALRQGRCFLANHEEGDPAGFTFLARTRGEWAFMGQEIQVAGAGGVHFSTRTPRGYGGAPRLRILKDGQPIAQTLDCDLQVTDQGPGVYRVEAWLNGRGWIFSNPIYLREGQVQ
ncbi:MAG TPA: CehA/McbA family metallohydrolase [Symbiobacteriaceae bacterium]|jgi:hypothetical protein